MNKYGNSHIYMVSYAVEFEWDYSKEQANIAKHGYAFLDAIESFQDPDGVKLTDSKHSEKEPRFFWVGKTSKNKIFNNMVYSAWK